MKQVTLGINNIIDICTLTANTSFESSLPITNLQIQQLNITAWTTSIVQPFTITATFPVNTNSDDIAHQVNYFNVGCIAILNHNLSQKATVNFKVYDGNTVVHDSGLIYAYPYLSELDPYWDNGETFTAKIIDINKISKCKKDIIYYLPSNLKATKVEFTIYNSSNAESHFKIGRLFIGEQLIPNYNVQYNDLNLGVKDLSQVTTSLNGIRHFTEYSKIRIINASFKLLFEKEGFALNMAQHNGGLSGEVIVSDDKPVYTIIDTKKAVSSKWFQLAFIGQFTQLDPLTIPVSIFHAMNLSIEEIAR